jgi:type III secretion system YscI/HrpB-like protein
MAAVPQVDLIEAAARLLKAPPNPASNAQSVSTEDVARFEKMLFAPARKTAHGPAAASAAPPVDLVQAASQFLRSSQPQDPAQLENLLFAPPQKTAEIKALEFFQKQSTQAANPLSAASRVADDPATITDPAAMLQLQSSLTKNELSVEVTSKLAGMLSQDINKLSAIQ